MTQKAVDKATKYAVPALEKGLDILEFLADAAIPQTQADIARALDRNTSEIFRMLDCLEQRAYLLRDDSGRYGLSLKLFELAHTHSPVEKLLEAARSPLRTIAQNLRESVHLSILHEQKLLVLAEELSPNPIRISVEVGRSFPALKTASGRLLLAQQSQEALEHFLQNDPPFLNSSLIQQESFRQQLQASKGQTFLNAESDISVGVQDLAVLIGHERSQLMATLTVPLLMLKGKNYQTEQILAALQESAKDITKRLGLGL